MVPSIKAMVQTLIATPSVSSTVPQFDLSNKPVVDELATWLESVGFGVQLQPVSADERKVNIIATLGQGRDGLLLSGHTDTVPCDEALWQSNPFDLTETDERWYGLGVCDMKSFLALCVHAASQVDVKQLKRPLTILGTADEESSMNGARILDHGQLGAPRFAVIGEPTNLAPVTRHKSIAMLGLRLTGSSGHSSDPSLGNSALNVMGDVINTIKDVADGLQNFSDNRFAVSFPTLNMGCIHGGDNPNRICDHVNLEFDLRLLPGMHENDVLDRLRDRLTEQLAPTGISAELDHLHPPVGAFESGNEEFADACEALAEKHQLAVSFGTEAPFLSQLGINTVVMGPGSINQAHQPNEFLDVDQITPTVDILRALIQKYCVD